MPNNPADHSEASDGARIGLAAIRKLKPADLPAPPHAAAQIVQACSNPSMGAKQLAKIVASDPVLTAEILRTVNSALFGLTREIRSAPHAVAVLGNRALRNLALCLAVRDALKPGAIPGLDMVSYWEDALRRAVGASLLAKHIKFDPDEGFTIGLLQDFGMMAMMFAMPDRASHWKDLRTCLPDRRRKLEHRYFSITHDQVGLMLARTWALPRGLALPMAAHHSLGAKSIPKEHLKACALAYCADHLAAVFSTENKKRALDRCHAVLKEQFNLTGERVDQILEVLPLGVEEAAAALGLRVKEQPKLEDVVRAANRQLVEENMSYQDLTIRLERMIAEKNRLASQLEKANKQLESLAYYDPLTDLVNRRGFDEVFRSEIARHSRTGQPLTLVMVDLDKFKNINDNYGHPFGDTVLQAVADAMRKTLRTADTKARIGGEEMVLVLPETDADAGLVSANRVRAAIEALVLQGPSCRVPITSSFGVCTWSGSAGSADAQEKVAKRMMDAADSALYGAKENGRNQVGVRPFHEDA